MEDLIGREVLNYKLISFIGSGGMGSVYLAQNKYISKQKVAIKIINGNCVNEFTKKILADEAQSLASLNHNNIVRFYNFHIDEDGSIYLIMEYVDGIRLDKYIEQVSGLIVEERLCDFIDPILDAFSYAHKQGIIHCDIKPSNIIVTKDGVPKILDFGIARMLNGDQNYRNNMIMGTPSYMSPEQVKGEPLTVSSDIYSIGVLVNQMLTGKAPYDTTTLTEHEIYTHVVEAPLPRMKEIYEYVSDAMQDIVDKATAKNREDRFQSCNELKEAIHNAICKEDDDNSVEVVEKKSGGKKKGWIFVLLALCVVAGVGAFYFKNQSQPIEPIQQKSVYEDKYIHFLNLADSLVNIGDVAHWQCLVESNSMFDTLAAIENLHYSEVEAWIPRRREIKNAADEKINMVINKMLREAESKVEYAVFDDDYQEAFEIYKKVQLLRDDADIRKRIENLEAIINK